MKTPDDIKPLSDMVEEYFTKCYELCGRNKTLTAEKIGISLRSVKNYCTRYKLPSKETTKPKSEATTENYPSHYNCIPKVTPSQRDDWYNRNFF